MNQSNDNRLDRLLEDWADRSAVCTEDLTTLRQRIVKRLDDSDNNDKTVALGLPLPDTATRRFAAVGLVAAAVLLFALGVWWNSLRQPPAETPLQFATLGAFDSDASDFTGSFQAYWPKHLRRQKRLLTEYRGVFGQGVAWLSETEQSCDVGLVRADASERVPSEYVVVQLWLVARNVQSGQSEVHTISLLAGREEMVELPLAAGSGHLVLWAHPVDEEMISIDLRYQPASVAGVEIDGSNLQRIGQVTNIHNFDQDGVEYKLYQTADLLDSDDFG